jgi:UDPglucose 6-dehydrogenase
MRITMVGTGYVGLVTGTCFANTGNDVTCLDIDPAKIDMLERGESPIYEPGLSDLIKRNTKAGRLHFTTDKRSAYGGAEIVFICVGTPPDASGHADLGAVLGAAADIGQAIEEGPGNTVMARQPKIVVIKSTVPVGTNARVRDEIAKHTAKPFNMASNPEFLKEGDAIHDFSHPDRVVIGVADKLTGDTLRELYEPFVRQGNPIFVMDIPSAEMVKYAANTMLATKISFINEIANLCEQYDADIDEVRRGMCSDKRIGNQFLYPGLGYGGSCFPKDVLACISMGRQVDQPAQLLEAVDHVNQAQRARFMRKIDQHFGGNPDQPADLAGKHLALWGIAFKPGTDDIREAPALTLIEALLERGATVAVFDQVAMENCRRMFGERVKYAENELDVLDGADGLVICTNWGEFLHPEYEEMTRRMRQPVVFDGRNLYRRETMAEHGFVYYSVGRAPVGV